jgi:hypothetical protein
MDCPVRLLLSKGVNTAILDIIQLPVFYLKNDVSGTGFCLRLNLPRNYKYNLLKSSLKNKN